MARGKASARAGKARPSLPVEVPRLTVEEGRTALHSYVKEFRGLEKPSASLLERAVEVGPRRQGGLLLVPEIDALAAVNRLDQVERENDALLDELEVVGIVLLAEARLAEPAPAEGLIPIEELARKHGFAELLGD